MNKHEFLKQRCAELSPRRNALSFASFWAWACRLLGGVFHWSRSAFSSIPRGKPEVSRVASSLELELPKSVGHRKKPSGRSKLEYSD